jgi:hypothetical protein
VKKAARRGRLFRGSLAAHSANPFAAPHASILW